MPKCLFDMIQKQIYLLHLNIGNLKSRLKDIEIDTIMKSAHIISLNETHLVQKETLTPKMMGLTQDVSIFDMIVTMQVVRLHSLSIKIHARRNCTKL